MESCCSGSEKSSGFFGIVPGSFQKVPEDSGGVRKSRNCSTTSNTAAWAVRGRPSLNGTGAPAPQGPCAWERGNPKGEGFHLTWEALLPPWPPPPPQIGSEGAGPPLPCPYIYVGGGRAAAPKFWRSPPPLPSTPHISGCLAKPCWITTLLHHHHAIVLLLDGVFLNLSLSP